MKRTYIHPQISPNRSPFINLTSYDLKKFLKKQKTQEEISIVYFGTPEFSAYVLEKLIDFTQNSAPVYSHLRGVSKQQPRFAIQAVITSPDKPVGRKQEIKPSEVSLVAQKYGLPLLKPEKLDEEFLTDHSSLITSDLFIVVSFGKILPKALLDIPKFGAINVHGSLLPKYRGASPIQQAILSGDRETGVTIILMEEKMDLGPILAKKRQEISPKDTFESLSIKMAQIAAPLLINTIQKLVSREIKPQVQDNARATYCPIIKKEDGYFDINNPPSPKTLDRMIRAYYPWPNAWTLFRASSTEAATKAGQDSRGQARIVKFLPEGMVQMEGKKKVKLKDFLNGYPDFPIKSLNF